RFGHRLDDAFSHPLGALCVAASVDQQGELVAAQAGDLVACLQLALQASDHLQDQAVASLVPQSVVGMTEVVQVQMTKSYPSPVVLGQARSQQGLEALAVGDASQRVLLG